MKVVICSCARCTSQGNEFLHDAVNTAKSDLDLAYQTKKIEKKAEIEFEQRNLTEDIDHDEHTSPVAKIDDTYIKRAKPEIIMETIFKEYYPEGEGL